jgi:RimJ/RimL family protein N-acetyltransferase
MIATGPAARGRNVVGAAVAVRQDRGMEPVEIREADLLLRPWRAEDADVVFRACQDPDIQRWTPTPQPYLREHAEEFVGEQSTRAWAEGTAARFAVLDAGGEEPVGYTGLVRFDPDTKSGEIGFWTAPWARGRGVATRSARAVARWGFAALGVRRLLWRAEIGNHASRAVAARLGMRVEGVARQALLRRPGGALADGWIGALLPGELREADAPLSPADTLIVHRAAAFGRPQPELAAWAADGTALRVRPLAERDLDAIAAACQDAESARWTGLPVPYRLADAQFFVHEHGPGQWARGDGIACAIADADDAYSGSIELRISGDDPSVADVGYLVAPWARGRGFAPAALRELCRWGFDALALRRIEWRAYVGNTASRRVAEKAGFTVEGVARGGCVQRGDAHDAWTASLLRGEL